jgi:hypothetical protein
MDLLPYVIAGGMAIVGSGGAAWAGVKAGLNGQKERLVRVENKVDILVVDVAKLQSRNDVHDAYDA